MSIVTFDQAKRLFQIGFQEMTFGAYWRDSKAFKLFEYDSNWNKTADANGCYSAPEVHDALQWFRDEKGIICAVERDVDWGEEHPFNGYYGGYSGTPEFTNKSTGVTESYPTFPEAESALLEALITYVEAKL